VAGTGAQREVPARTDLIGSVVAVTTTPAGWTTARTLAG
jgi:hypothetical protein